MNFKAKFVNQFVINTISLLFFTLLYKLRYTKHSSSSIQQLGRHGGEGERYAKKDLMTCIFLSKVGTEPPPALLPNAKNPVRPTSLRQYVMCIKALTPLQRTNNL